MPKHPPSEPSLRTYIAEIQRNLASGIAREQTHRHALQDLLEALDPSIDVFNDPKHIEVGAPDFTIRRRGQDLGFPVGWIETKDVGDDLARVEKSEQVKRYLGLPNLILTDYLEFRWYTDGKRRMKARLAAVGRSSKLLRDREGEQTVHTLLTEFLRHSIASVATPKELAERMARLAHIIRDILLRSFDSEGESGHLHGQFKAFRETLIPDLNPDQFADMYAQTIAYGLFAARCQPKTARQSFSRASAADLIPRTNPFLRKLFQSIAFELDERVLPFVDDLVALLREAEIDSIMADFGRRTAKEDPVVHFYENFLREYDPKVREMRGVYYTPEPVVSYIVRSVDYLLKTRFGKQMGLADKDVLILDPACGTGTFLFEVIRHIHAMLLEQGQKGQWNRYVSENLLKRVFGFELLMAPYTVAHLKLGLLLGDLGYQFDTDERLGVYLTNTLEEAIKRSEVIFAQWIADEANQASSIKKDKPIVVVLGNPPYSGISANKGPWITALIEDYKKIEGQPLGEKKHWLHDDYVKFIRFAQWRIERTGYGILAYITNHGYLDNPTFRGMRHSLAKTFSSLYVVDLHGNAKKQEKTPEGLPDKNVFDIKQGVALGIFAKTLTDPGERQLQRSDLWGSREEKYRVLGSASIKDTQWHEIYLRPPFFLFMSQPKQSTSEWEECFPITEIFGEYTSGIASARDHFVADMDLETLRRRITFFRDAESDSAMREQFELKDTRGWKLPQARVRLRQDRDFAKRFHAILYRPFDLRYMFYSQDLVDWPREKVMRHLLSGDNVALVCSRPQSPPEFTHVFCTNGLIDQCTASNKSRGGGNCYVFPLFVEGVMLDGGNTHERSHTTANFTRRFASALEESLHESLTRAAEAPGAGGIMAPDVFNYIYAVLHAPSYRKRYQQFLKVDFPRVPVTSDKKLFRALVERGRELVALHLMESPKLTPANFMTRYEQPGDGIVEKVRYDDTHQRVYINRTQYFEGVPKNVWEFYIGGYQVCEKWLKDRKGRQLSSDDIDHYQKIVLALAETIRLMREIDEVIPGWPLP